MIFVNCFSVKVRNLKLLKSMSVCVSLADWYMQQESTENVFAIKIIARRAVYDTVSKTGWY